MKIGIKLTLMIVILCLVIISSLGISLLFQACKNITELSHDKAIATASSFAGELETSFNSYWSITEVITKTLEGYDKIPFYNRREYINTLLENIIRNDNIIAGIWAVWNFDALDGNDSSLPDIPGTNSQGRFMPYWYRDGNRINVMPMDNSPCSRADMIINQSVINRNMVILNPFFCSLSGTNRLITSIIKPIFHADGTVLGIFGIDLELDVLHKAAQVNIPFGNGLTAVFANDGTIASHFDESRLGTLMQVTERDMAGPYLDDFLLAINRGELFTYSHFIEAAGAEFNIVVMPIYIGNSGTPWSYAIAVPRKTVMASLVSMEMMTLIISFIIMALVIPAAILLSASISKPIIKVADALKDIAYGEGDLTQVININSKDEIGDLANYFNQTLDKIKNMVIGIKKETVSISDLGNELAGNINETAAAINEITANVKSIKGRIVSQSASVTETNAAMNKITGNIEKLNSHVENQSSNITQASSAIEQMVANIQSVNLTLINNASSVKDLMEASEIGRRGLTDTAMDIKEIAMESEGLLEINSVMKNIASQTNLLSMNAAIEAAHAGNAGKGFAVVADEIRQLAESSREQSKSIGLVLKKIKSSIDKITSSTGDVLERFESIDECVKTVADQEENIRNAMEEQSTGSAQILQGVSNVNEITANVRTGSIEMYEGSREVIKEGSNLEKMTVEINGGMNEMAEGAEQINIAVNKINELSGMTRRNIELLVQEVSRFKVE